MYEMRRPNIILIGIDTLRADHLTCYGYIRKTSPNIDRIARESIMFTSAYATGIPTHPGWTTILTGVHPLVHGIVSHVGTRKLSPEIPMVQEVLRAN
ncbi:MAG: sulfatase, partial [Thermoprotei archaeon]